MLLQEEGREVKGYLNLYQSEPDGAVGPTALRLAQESKEHAETLTQMSGAAGEPWHKTGAGGFLRNVVYGFNDGLTANFGLVAGMIGAQGNLAAAEHAVVVAGLAGMVADALSMGSSGYLAAKSEREVFEHEIAMEREEIRLMPELEREELSLVYQAKGIPAAQADALATEVMRDPAKALDEKVREELKIGEATSTPMREAWITGTATALRGVHPGGAVPVRAPGRGPSGPRSRWRCSPTSASARPAASSPAAACFRSGWTCSWSGSAWRSSAISWETGSSSCCDPENFTRLTPRPSPQPPPVPR